MIEHPLRPGWTVATGESPAETTVSAARFRLTIAPHQEASLVVREVRTGETSLALLQVNDAWITQVTSSGVSGAELERALAPVLDKQRTLASVNDRFVTLTREQDTIAQDQARLRENMKALRGSAEEKPLLQRYARQLDAQETRLDTLKEEIAKTTLAQRSRKPGALADDRVFVVRPRGIEVIKTAGGWRLAATAAQSGDMGNKTVGGHG